MQGNSLIKTFAILFGIVSIYQLSFTFISSTLENKARNAAIEKISEDEISFAEKRASEEVRFLDSIGDLPVLMYSSYNDAKQKELNQGLDLKGGINVILQISIKDLLKGNKNVEVLFGSGKRVSSSFLHCVYLLNKEDSRFVVSVPKKNFSLAVDRNKLKRILREVVRKHSKEMLSFGGGWFMFIYSSEKVVSSLDVEKDFELLVNNIA